MPSAASGAVAATHSRPVKGSTANEFDTSISLPRTAERNDCSVLPGGKSTSGASWAATLSTKAGGSTIVPGGLGSPGSSNGAASSCAPVARAKT